MPPTGAFRYKMAPVVTTHAPFARRFTFSRGWRLVLGLVVFAVLLLNLQILKLSGKVDKLQERSVSFKICERPVKIQFDQTVLAKEEANTLWQNQKEDGKVLKLSRKGRGFLTIAVPFIKGKHAIDDLKVTLRSLVKKSSLHDELETIVAVFLLSDDQRFNDYAFRNITDSFMYEINIGFIQIMQVPQSHLEQFKQLEMELGAGSVNKTDPAFLTEEEAAELAFVYGYLYHSNMSRYTLSIPRDVICDENYVKHIQTYIDMQSGSWSMLEFSEEESVGILLKTDELLSLRQMLTLFYRNQPLSYIFPLFSMSKLQTSRRLRTPSLFQRAGYHIGDDHKSDFKDIVNDVIADGGGRWLANNPPANVTSSMDYDDKFAPGNAYSTGFGFFWAQEPKVGDWLLVTFRDDVHMKRIRVETGSQLHPKDILHHGMLEISPANRGKCKDYIYISEFEDGQIDIGNVDKIVGKPVKCLRIKITQDHADSIVFNQILVF